MAAIDKETLAYLANRGLGVTHAFEWGRDPTEPPSVYLHHFSAHGAWLWIDADSARKVSRGRFHDVEPGIEPVPATAPTAEWHAEEMSKARAELGLPPDAPIYATNGELLRLWKEDGHWFLDNTWFYNLGTCRRSFLWDFESLEQAVDTAFLFFERGKKAVLLARLERPNSSRRIPLMLLPPEER